MNDPDVVAELDEYMRVMPVPVFQRARAEIVALRAQLRTRAVMDGSLAQVPGLLARSRTEALEEAAQLCFRANPQSNPNAMGHAIRALKDKRDE